VATRARVCFMNLLQPLVHSNCKHFILRVINCEVLTAETSGCCNFCAMVVSAQKVMAHMARECAELKRCLRVCYFLLFAPLFIVFLELQVLRQCANACGEDAAAATKAEQLPGGSLCRAWALCRCRGGWSSHRSHLGCAYGAHRALSWPQQAGSSATVHSPFHALPCYIQL
jgi:hypothetical protein